MTIDTIKHLGVEFHRAADDLADTLAQLDNARLERLTFLRRCSKDSTARLATLKEEIRTLPEQIAKWDAEAARLESQTAEDLLRQALEPARKEKPEPHRAGLPPERLRKVWAEWDVQERGGPADLPLEFSQDGRLCRWADGKEWFAVIEASAIWDGRTFRPHGATWSRVEAMADEAEKPTLLDLTKLPPGTVCEALGVIQRASMPSIIVAAGELFRIHKSDAVRDEMAMIESYSTSGLGYWVPALVPARVVKEGGEDAPR
jgi:hypothetical protein